MINKNLVKRVIKSKNFHYSGWLTSVVLLVAIVTMGATDPKGKTGRVDFDRVLQESKIGKQKSQNIQMSSIKRQELLKFLDQYNIASKPQAEKLKALFLLENLTEVQKKDLEDQKKLIMAEDAKRIQLSQKKELTDEEKTALSNYSANSIEIGQTLQIWSSEFNEELYSARQKGIQEAIEKAKASLNKTAKAQGYSKVFNANILPYSANDLTEATIKEMDKG